MLLCVYFIFSEVQNIQIKNLGKMSSFQMNWKTWKNDNLFFNKNSEAT